MIETPSHISTFTDPQKDLADVYFKTFDKHHLSIEDFEIKYERFQKIVKYSGLTEDEARQDFDNMKVHPQDTENRVQKLIEKYKVKEFFTLPQKILLICSPYSGIGKTRMAKNLINQFYRTYVVEKHQAMLRDHRWLPSCYFMEMREYKCLVEDYKANFRSPLTLNDTITQMQVLSLDDILKSNEHFEYIYDLIDRVSERDLPLNKLIITTNKSWSEIEGTDNRLVSRLSSSRAVRIDMSTEYWKKIDWRDKKID